MIFLHHCVRENDLRFNFRAHVRDYDHGYDLPKHVRDELDDLSENGCVQNDCAQNDYGQNDYAQNGCLMSCFHVFHDFFHFYVDVHE